jgi:hypothetical protein
MDSALAADAGLRRIQPQNFSSQQIGIWVKSGTVRKPQECVRIEAASNQRNQSIQNNVFAYELVHFKVKELRKCSALLHKRLWHLVC